MILAIAVLSVFILAALAPALVRARRAWAGWLLALLPAGITVYLLMLLPQIAQSADQALYTTVEWVPSLGISLSLYLDGLSALMGLLVAGIGTLIVIYAAGYLHDDKHLGEFFAYLLLFQGSMLGVVLSGNLLTLFVFWELTSISSFALIGYKHKGELSRRAALQALLVTGGGGLAMLGGLVLIGLAGGTYELPELLSQRAAVQGHPWYLAIVILIWLGCFTKSAQVPFHFWLPDAMEAPTPVSAYLHSATMVKAGIYLLARLTPLLGALPDDSADFAAAWYTQPWFVGTTAIGALTMLVGGYLAWQQTDLKRILAYSTISVLGTLTMLLGIGTEAAVEGAMLFILAHALYKGALFMAAGTIDHETGTRDVRRLRGLRRAMPVLAVAVALAALSKAGIPFLLGFVGKEVLYDATLHAPGPGALRSVLVVAAVLGNVMVGAAAGLVALRPFGGDSAEADTPRHPHRAPARLVLGPVVLAALSVALGVYPQAAATLVGLSTGAVLGHQLEPLKLSVFHGINTELILSAVTVTLAVLLYLALARVAPLARRANGATWGPAYLYDRGLVRFLDVADRITLLLQNGNLRYYLNVIIGAAVALVGLALVRVEWAFDWSGPLVSAGPAGVYETLIGVIIVVAAIAAVRFESRLAAVTSLGVIGFCVAVYYILFSAPDLAMTQFSIETLSVVLIALIIGRLPRYASEIASRPDRTSDIVIAGAVGMVMTAIVLLTTVQLPDPQLADYFAAAGYEVAKGKNIVNVILVDFRGFDTMGEITVLSIAGLGVFVLSRLRLGKDRPIRDEEIDG